MLCVVDIFNVQMWGVVGVRLVYTSLLVGEGGIDIYIYIYTVQMWGGGKE